MCAYGVCVQRNGHSRRNLMLPSDFACPQRLRSYIRSGRVAELSQGRLLPNEFRQTLMDSSLASHKPLQEAGWLGQFHQL